MAFQTQSSANAQPTNDSWRAQGFLNLYLPRADGGRTKLGAIPLKDSRVNEQKLRAWLEQDPSRVSVVLSKLIIEYQSAEPAEGSGFDLSETTAPVETMPEAVAA